MTSILLAALLSCSGVNYDYIVNDRDEFVRVLKTMNPGESIYINGNPRISLTGFKTLEIPTGVTITGSRSKKPNTGALIFTDDIGAMPLFKAIGPGIIISHLRIRGPDPERRTDQMQELFDTGGWDAYYSVPRSIGVWSEYDITITDSEIWQWSYSAIYLKNSTGSLIKNNYIHHNQRHMLGYGITVDGAYAVISHNTFDYNRHSIAGTGEIGSGYEAKYNTVLKNASSWPFDMHELNGVAGTKVLIHNNKFYPHPLDKDVFTIIYVRGTPEITPVITDNCFIASELRAIKCDNCIPYIKDNKFESCKAMR